MFCGCVIGSVETLELVYNVGQPIKTKTDKKDGEG